MAPLSRTFEVRTKTLAYQTLHEALRDAKRYVCACANAGHVWVTRGKLIPTMCTHCHLMNKTEVFPICALIPRGLNSREPNIIIYNGAAYQVRPIADMVQIYKIRRRVARHLHLKNRAVEMHRGVSLANAVDSALTGGSDR